MANGESGAGFLAIILMLVCIAGMMMHVGDIQGTYMASWDSTSGTVTQHSIFEFSDNDRFGIEIIYTYTVENTDYSNRQIVGSFNTSDQAQVEMEENYPIGGRIEVYHSPHLPSWSDLNTNEGPKHPIFEQIWFAIGISAAGLICLAIWGQSDKSRITSLVSMWTKIISNRNHQYLNSPESKSLIIEMDRLVMLENLDSSSTRIPRIERLQDINKEYMTTSKVTITVMMGIAIIGLFYTVIVPEIFARVAVIFGLPPLGRLIESIWWPIIAIPIIGYFVAQIWSRYKSIIIEQLATLRNQFPSLIHQIIILAIIIGTVIGIGISFLSLALLFIMFAYFGTIGASAYLIYLVLKPFTYLLLPENVIYQQGLPLLISQLIGLLVPIFFYRFWFRATYDLNRFRVGGKHTDSIMLPEKNEILALTTSEQLIAFSYKNGMVYLYHNKNSEIITLRSYSTITSLAINQHFLVGCSDQGILHTWDLKSYDLDRTTTSLSGMTISLISEDYLLVADQNSHFIVINLKTEEIIFEIDLDLQAIVSIQSTSKSTYIIDISGKLVEINHTSGEIKQEQQIPETNCMAIGNSIDTGNDMLYVGKRKEGINSYNLLTLKEEEQFSTASSVRSIIVVDSYLIAGLADGQLQLFDLANNNQTSLIEIHLFSVDFLNYSAPYLISGSSDGTVKTFNLYQNLLPSIESFDPMSNSIVPQQWISQKRIRDLVYCYICMNHTKPSDQIVRCPSCKSSFHRKEINDWFRTKLICPICRDEVSS